LNTGSQRISRSPRDRIVRRDRLGRSDHGLFLGLLARHHADEHLLEAHPDLVQLLQRPAAAHHQRHEIAPDVAVARGLDDEGLRPVARRQRLHAQHRGEGAERLRHVTRRPGHVQLDARGGEDLLHQLRLRALRDDAPAIDDDDAVADHGHLGQDMRRQDHRVLAGERADQGPDLGDLPGVEADGGLVEDEHIRVPEQRLREADALPVALRQLADHPVAHVRDEAAVHHVGDPPPARAAPHPFDLRHEVEVGRHRQVRVEGRVLGQVSDAAPHLERLGEDVEARHTRRARAGRHEAREDLHRGGLAGAVRAEKADDAALVDAEGHAVDRGDRPVVLGKLIDLDHDMARCPPGRPVV
jgi:hypothetical protein